MRIIVLLNENLYNRNKNNNLILKKRLIIINFIIILNYTIIYYKYVQRKFCVCKR